MSGCGCFLVATGLSFFSAWFMYEVMRIRERWTKADYAIVWSSGIGLVVGLLGLLIGMFLTKMILEKMARKRAEQGGT